MKKVIVLLALFLGAFSLQTQAKKWRAKHVVIIGIDGWGAYYHILWLVNLYAKITRSGLISK